MPKQSKQNFEILPHQKGICIKARGYSLEELFSTALEGVSRYLNPDIAERMETEPNVTQEVFAEAVDLNSLLVDFLTQVVGYRAMRNLAFMSVLFSELGENFLKGKLSGIEMRDAPEKEIREVSYDEIEIKRNAKSGRYEAVIVCEI